tara:strand:+ start:178 stop:432 length:255 start_codon:yes stop_codon:yes gene_type:complete
MLFGLNRLAQSHLKTIAGSRKKIRLKEHCTETTMNQYLSAKTPLVRFLTKISEPSAISANNMVEGSLTAKSKNNHADTTNKELP